MNMHGNPFVNKINNKRPIWIKLYIQLTLKNLKDLKVL